MLARSLARSPPPPPPAPPFQAATEDYVNNECPSLDPAPADGCPSVANPGTSVCGSIKLPASCNGRGQVPWFSAAWRSRVVAVDPAITDANTVTTVQYTPPAWSNITLSAADAEVASYVVGSETFSYTFGQQQQLTDFPFDTQTLTWRLDLPNFGTADMALVLSPAMASGSALALPVGSPDGYTVTAYSAAVTGVPSAFGLTSRLTVAYTMSRIPTFYINRFILPLCLLFVVTPLSVAMPPPTPGRFVPITAFAITVTFVFVAGQSTPILPYTTRLDKFFLLCFFTSAICLFYTFLIFCRTERSKKSIAESRKRNGGRFVCCPTWLGAAAAEPPPPPPAAAEKAVVSIELVATTGVTTADAAAAPPPVVAPSPPPAALPPSACCSIFCADELDRSDTTFATLMILGFSMATAIICAAPNI